MSTMPRAPRGIRFVSSRDVLVEGRFTTPAAPIAALPPVVAASVAPVAFPPVVVAASAPPVVPALVAPALVAPPVVTLPVVTLP